MEESVSNHADSGPDRAGLNKPTSPTMKFLQPKAVETASSGQRMHDARTDASRDNTRNNLSTVHERTVVFHPSLNLLKRHNSFRTLVQAVLFKRTQLDNERQRFGELQKHVTVLNQNLISELSPRPAKTRIRVSDGTLIQLQNQLTEAVQKVVSRTDYIAELERDLGAEEHDLLELENLLYTETKLALLGVGWLVQPEEDTRSVTSNSMRAKADHPLLLEYYSLIGDISNLKEALNDLEIDHQQDIAKQQQRFVADTVMDVQSKELFENYIKEHESLTNELRNTEKEVRAVKQQCIAAGLKLNADDRPYSPTQAFSASVSAAILAPGRTSNDSNTTNSQSGDLGPIEPLRYIAPTSQESTTRWLTGVLQAEQLDTLEPHLPEGISTPLTDSSGIALEGLRRSSFSQSDQSEIFARSEAPISRDPLHEQNFRERPQSKVWTGDAPHKRYSNPNMGPFVVSLGRPVERPSSPAQTLQ